MYISDRRPSRRSAAVLAVALGFIGFTGFAEAQAAAPGSFRLRSAPLSSSVSRRRPSRLPRECSNCCCYLCHGGSGSTSGNVLTTPAPTTSPVQNNVLQTPAPTTSPVQNNVLKTPAPATGTVGSANLKARTPQTATAKLTTPRSVTRTVRGARLGGFIRGGVALTSSIAEATLNGGYLPALLGLGGYPAYPEPYSDDPAAGINAQGNYLVNVEQSRSVREYVRQRRLDTRRRMFDEYLYERQNAPTWEDDRELFQSEELRRSRNNPPLNEIMSARALNALLDYFQKQVAAGVLGEDVPLPEDVVCQLNVTCGRGGYIGLIKNGPRLHWPVALTGDAARADRTQIDTLLAEVLPQVGSHAVDADTINAMGAAADRLREYVAQESRNLPPGQYIEAKHFLTDLQEAFKALQQPDVADYLTRKRAARGRTVAELVRSMTEQGLHFAPATTGDEAAYLALHRALALYDLPFEE